MDLTPELAKTLITTLGVVNKKIAELEIVIIGKDTVIANKDKFIAHLQSIGGNEKIPNHRTVGKVGSFV